VTLEEAGVVRRGQPGPLPAAVPGSRGFGDAVLQVRDQGAGWRGVPGEHPP
jgi:hypothetical protein